ncbi:hypothetical protein H5410_028179 [Solanum commersonii]|uniref:Uncharacterized protein n=1 Tax=Solanum commersonii TaxID=4109 RepID=A0A9J5Z478_SOLCO|nr:hypothetical protein H5410_028179 [Solanum commersonii]
MTHQTDRRARSSTAVGTTWLAIGSVKLGGLKYHSAHCEFDLLRLLMHELKSFKRPNGWTIRQVGSSSPSGSAVHLMSLDRLLIP